MESIHLRKFVSLTVHVTDISMEDLNEMESVARKLFKIHCVHDIPGLLVSRLSVLLLPLILDLFLKNLDWDWVQTVWREGNKSIKK